MTTSTSGNPPRPQHRTKGETVTQIVSTFNDDVLEVDAAELLDLQRQGLVREVLDDAPGTPPAKVTSTPPATPILNEVAT
jgi:hypothetical protein